MFHKIGDEKWLILYESENFLLQTRYVKNPFFCKHLKILIDISYLRFSNVYFREKTSTLGGVYNSPFFPLSLLAYEF